jgi:predicted nuclease of predicted toxin-antitoxin system
MKIKLDENLPEALIPQLTLLGHDADNARLEKVQGKSDAVIWLAAQKSKRFFITQDLDFSDIRQFAPGMHQGLMLVRLRVPGRLALAAKISEAFAMPEAKTWTGCFVLLTDHKLRVHSPPASKRTR